MVKTWFRHLFWVWKSEFPDQPELTMEQFLVLTSSKDGVKGSNPIHHQKEKPQNSIFLEFESSSQAAWGILISGSRPFLEDSRGSPKTVFLGFGLIELTWFFFSLLSYSWSLGIFLGTNVSLESILSFSSWINSSWIKKENQNTWKSWSKRIFYSSFNRKRVCSPLPLEPKHSVLLSTKLKALSSSWGLCFLLLPVPHYKLDFLVPSYPKYLCRNLPLEGGIKAPHAFYSSFLLCEANLFDRTNQEETTFVDMAVFNNNQHFRIYGQTKAAEYRPFIVDKNFELPPLFAKLTPEGTPLIPNPWWRKSFLLYTKACQRVFSLLRPHVSPDPYHLSLLKPCWCSPPSPLFAQQHGYARCCFGIRASWASKPIFLRSVYRSINFFSLELEYQLTLHSIPNAVPPNYTRLKIKDNSLYLSVLPRNAFRRDDSAQKTKYAFFLFKYPEADEKVPFLLLGPIFWFWDNGTFPSGWSFFPGDHTQNCFSK